MGLGRTKKTATEGLRDQKRVWRAVRTGAFVIGMAVWGWWELESCTGYSDGELLACQGIEWWQGLEVVEERVTFEQVFND